MKVFFNPDPKKFSAPKLKKPIKKKREPTGELQLFREIFKDQRGKCFITGEDLDFNVWCFLHILSKGAYPDFRLYKKNVIMVKSKIHLLYDNESKERLLKEFPKSIIIYEKKEELKTEYYKRKNAEAGSI